MNVSNGKKGAASARSTSRRPQEVLLGGEGLGWVNMLLSQPKIDFAHSLDESSCNMMVVQPIAAIHAAPSCVHRAASAVSFLA